MTVNANGPTDQNALADGKGDNQQQDNSAKIKDPDAFIKKHEELLEKLSKSNKALKEYQEKDRLREEDEAKKRGDYEKLLKSREDEICKLSSEVSSYKSRMENASKLASVLDAAGTDIERKWYSLIPLEDIVVNPETNEIDQMSVTKTVENLKKSWPEMFKKQGKPMPNESPQGNGAGTITRSEWLALPSKEMSKWKPNQVKD